MTRYGVMFGPDTTFLGVPRCDLDDPESFAGSRVVVLGAPFDSGTSYRSGARFGPSAIRSADYLHQDGSRPHLALRVDPLVDLGVADAGDVEMTPGELRHALRALTSAVGKVLAAGSIPVILGGDHTAAMADVAALAEHYGRGRIAVIHFDAHADTGDREFGSLYGHGQPFRRLIESGALRPDRLIQVGLRGYWPGPEELGWMAERRIRSFEMAEIGARGLDEVLAEALQIAGDDTDGVFLSVDIDVVDPGSAPGTGTPEPGGLSARQLLDAVRRIGRESALVGMEIVEVAPAYDTSDVTALLANRVVLETLAGVARRSVDEAAGTTFDHTIPVLAQRVATPRASTPGRLRVLLVGAGGVGSALASTVSRRSYLETMVVADYDLEKANRCVDLLGDGRIVAEQVDATDEDAVADLLGRYECDILVNATDPRFVMPLFRAALAGRVHYIDMAMSLSHPHPSDPYTLTGTKLGDEQFAMEKQWRESGRLALVGMGVEPGLSDVFARYAADTLFSTIDEIGVRDGGNIEVDGHDFAPTFSIWTTIEECLNPPVIYEQGRGWFTTVPFSEPEVFEFPDGIGPVECVNVEHEEVLLIPRWVAAKRVTFKYGLGKEFIEILKMQHKLGIDSTTKIQVGGVAVSPRDVIAALLPDPATLGDRMHGKTCAGSWVRGLGKDQEPLEVYLYHVVDNDWSMHEYGSQAVVWQTAVCPVVAMELIATGVWSGAGVLGPEAFDARPFLDLLNDYGPSWGVRYENGTGPADAATPDAATPDGAAPDAAAPDAAARTAMSPTAGT